MGIRKATGSSRSVKKKAPIKVPIELYEHKGKQRPNNPPVGLVDQHTDPEGPAKKYSYDPHLDPCLQWSGKAERTSFEIPTVSLHTHEFIDPRSIIETVRKTNTVDYSQLSLFNKYERERSLNEEIQFYKHKKNWVNRLIAGDSLLVMNSLLEKEGQGEKVQMIYIDPPYGIKYGSNFQPFVNKRDVKDGNDADLNSEPEMLRAFRDTWELGIHSYLTYLRDRLILSKDLLTQSGSCFVQISVENLHFVKSLMEEIFGKENFVSVISYATTSGFNSETLARSGDYLVWFAKDRENLKYRPIFVDKDTSSESSHYKWVMFPDGTYRGVTSEEQDGTKKLPKDAKLYTPDNLISQGETKSPQEFKYKGKTYTPGPGRHWKTSLEGMKRLAELNRIHVAKDSLRYVRYADDFPVKPLNNFWVDTATGNFTDSKLYVVQTGSKVIERCILMTTDPGDLVFDPTCGSGTTAFMSERWGRRWITCDTSRVAATLAKQRIMTAHFDYYRLEREEEGVDSGLKYKKVKRITLGSLANNEQPEEVRLYNQPEVDKGKVRVSGPFTVEAVPAQIVMPLSGPGLTQHAPSEALARTGETNRQREWRDELVKTGIRAKNKNMIEFARLEILPGSRWVHATGETKGDSTKVVVSFGPDHAPLEQRQVALAIEEAQTLVPKPKMVVFASFQFDPEAAKEIDELNWPGVQILKVQMNPDLFTGDLKKKRSSNESFWLMGQPDIDVRTVKGGDYDGLFKVEVHGFDYFNPVTGAIESGGTKNIAMWMLDPDYDGRSIFPRQVFFPLGSAGDRWEKLARTLKTEIDEELIEAYRGTVSLPFAAGTYKRIAVKIIDDRGIESLRIISLENDN